MRIVVTGRNGQLAQSLLFLAPQKGIEVIAIGRPELDLLVPSKIFPVLQNLQPDVIVSAAAYTAVDQAEREPEKAFAVNSIGAEGVAKAAERLKVPVIHLSTDYVFSGDKIGPYVETDPTGPISVYGKTKLEGERLVSASNANHIILRTAWVYSPFGNNFVKTMLELAGTKNELRVVADQLGCPTSALDIADAIFTISNRLLISPHSGLNGVFHLTGSGETTWAEFAKEIFDQSTRLGGPSAEVVRIASDDYPAIAIRPLNSRLSGKKLAETYGIRLPAWQSSVSETLHQLHPQSTWGE